MPRRDVRRFRYPLCGREWMRTAGSALDLVGRDEDGPIGDRWFLFGAAIEGERTYAIQTSELGAQDAEDHYALEGL
ncbi:MAG: hypothetical protein JNM84_08100 [Planctomycetes bacterium]|nr:hypothetical protein [Planctomycetota bacterium]